VVSLLNIAVNAYIFRIVPEFTMRFMIWLLSHSMYRVQHRDLERFPMKARRCWCATTCRSSMRC
jgi:hypothetical protein